MNSLKDRILAIRDNVHSTEAYGEKIYYKLFKASHRQLINKIEDPAELDATLFALCVCDEEGKPVFDTSDINQVLDLPGQLVSHMVSKILSGSEKKQQGD